MPCFLLCWTMDLPSCYIASSHHLHLHITYISPRLNHPSALGSQRVISSGASSPRIPHKSRRLLICISASISILRTLQRFVPHLRPARRRSGHLRPIPMHAHEYILPEALLRTFLQPWAYIHILVFSASTRSSSSCVSVCLL